MSPKAEEWVLMKGEGEGEESVKGYNRTPYHLHPSEHSDAETSNNFALE